ncbi:MAG: SH3 domain-containing protein [Cyanothece sp. SIO1E1]|nr:SH3 domain-containing protein [Cyanothece sp. SIO1E1]
MILSGASIGWVTPVARAEQPLFVAYPPAEHQTTAAQIFLIGTAPPEGEVLVNGAAIEGRSAAGHFAPSLPLAIGENVFTLRYEDQKLILKITRVSTTPTLPAGLAFGENSLTPAVDIARLPDELLCFGAIAPANADVSVLLGDQTILLQSQPQTVDLPPNSAVLTQQNQPHTVALAENYQGCTVLAEPGDWGKPQFQLIMAGKTVTQTGPGAVEILPLHPFQVAAVTVDEGIARTGPSTDYSRITPLPKGTQAAVIGREGEWLKLDYGGWIKAQETQILQRAVLPRSIIRSARSRQVEGWTEVVLPLQVPVPVSVQQGDRTFTLTLHNTMAQTDTIFFNDDPAIARLDWHPILPDKVQYTFTFKSEQQWGYKLRYEGTSLILSLRHPPVDVVRQPSLQKTPLQGLSILLDPGHGSPADLGARGPTGYPEKDVTLIMAKLLRAELIARGATIHLTREGDEDLYPRDRVAMINQIEPAIALSLHYNALPDSGDAINTAGIGTFWYHAQAHDLSVFLHNYLVETLERPSYGVFWNNLALTRPTVAPAVLLELGFMINPNEFEWIVDAEAQQALAAALADGIVAWIQLQQPKTPG